MKEYVYVLLRHRVDGHECVCICITEKDRVNYCICEYFGMKSVYALKKP